MNDDVIKHLVEKQANKWLKQNPLMLDSKEKQNFLIGLNNYLENEVEAVDDEVFDFLVQSKLIKNKPREETFLNYLISKHGSLKNKNILDVGAGRICSLSKGLSEVGGRVTAIDTNIRLSNEELRKLKIASIKKLFWCDEYSKNGIGTNIEKFDLVVGLEPCDATEHIIRQSLKYDKPFDVYLCGAPHKGLNGENFSTYKDWYNHLESISNDVLIIEHDGGFIATNN